MFKGKEGLKLRFALLVLGGFAVLGLVFRLFPVSKADSQITNQSIVRQAASHLGEKNQNFDPPGQDARYTCSAFVTTVLRELDLVPHTCTVAKGYWPPNLNNIMKSNTKFKPALSPSDITPANAKQLILGDVLFFYNEDKNRATHVGIYAGNNEVIHTTQQGHVIQSNFIDSHTSKYIAAFRLVQTKSITGSDSGPLPAQQAVAPEKPRVIFVYSTTNCNDCIGMSIVMDQLETNFQNKISSGEIEFTRLDYDKDKAVLSKYIDPKRLPTVLLKKDEDELNRYSGVQSYEALKNVIQKLLDNTLEPAIASLQAIEDDKGNLNVTAKTLPEIAKVSVAATTTDNKTITKDVTPKNGLVTVTFTNDQTTTPTNPTITPKSDEPLILNYNFKNLLPIAHAQTAATTKHKNVKATGTDKNGVQKGEVTTAVTKKGSTLPTNPDGGSGTAAIGIPALLNSLTGLSKQLTPDGTPISEINARFVLFIRFMYALASATLVLGALWTGILYITSIGNEEQATKAKKGLLEILVGLLALLASFSIIELIRRVIESSRI